jgi:hypothetical protein
MQQMMKRSKENWQKRDYRLVDTTGLEKKRLHELVTGTTVAVLRHLNMDMRLLLTINPENWEASPRFLRMKQDIKSITVVNDSAERAMALMTEFNDTLTKNESEKQMLLQVVEENRQRITDVSKKTLIKAFKTRNV